MNKSLNICKLLGVIFLFSIFSLSQTIFSSQAQAQNQAAQNEVKGTVAPPGAVTRGLPGNVTGNATANAIGNSTEEASSLAGATSNSTSASPANSAAGLSGNGTADSLSNSTEAALGKPDEAFFKNTPEEPVEFSWSGYFLAVGGLLGFLGVLWMLVWLLRKRGAFPGGQFSGRGTFKVEASLALGPKRNLVLVRFLNSRFLLGVTDQQITLIKELEGQDAQGTQGAEQLSHFAAAMQQESQKNDS